MKRILNILMMMTLTMSVMAVPAKKGLWKTLPTSDGSRVMATLVGDEFGHSWKSADGRRFVMADGMFREQSAAAIEAAAQRRAKVMKHRAERLSKSTLVTDGSKMVQRRAANPAHFGKKKGLILLVNFNDVKFSKGHDLALYNNIANTRGYTDANGFKGSVSDYFRDQSRGQFELTFDVLGPLTVSHDMKYYGENDEEGNDKRPEEMVVEAVTLAKELVTDWKQYDWDDDGAVDQVMIIYAGEGEADGGSEDTIWPHEYELKYSDRKVDVADGLTVSTYAVANEGSDNGNSFEINGLGTICHEFSHCLGVPDMYDTGYGGNYGMGSWSLMDQGCYNGGGFVPSNYASCEKYAIGWITPTELTQAQQVSGMRALNDADDVYMVKNESHPKEYYLLENRQQKGWDRYVPAEGMLVLHVDYDESIWAWNLVNTYYEENGYVFNDHQRCTIFHADGVDKTGIYQEKINEAVENYYAAETDAEANKYLNEYYHYASLYQADVEGDVYPQPGNNQLTNTSLPRAFLYHANNDGRKLMNVAITDITQNADGTIAFNFSPDNSDSEEADNTDYGKAKPAVGETLFYESFDQCDGQGGNDGLWSGQVANGTFIADNEGWVAAKAFGANECAKFGTSSVKGSATTPAIAINGTGVLTFKAGAWKASADGTILNLSVSDGALSVTSVRLEKGGFNDYETTITATGDVKITFEAASGRFFLDEVIVRGTTASAIRTVEPTDSKVTRIFTLDGRYVGSDTRQLKRGLYIVGGKKLFVR